MKPMQALAIFLAIYPLNYSGLKVREGCERIFCRGRVEICGTDEFVDILSTLCSMLASHITA